MKRREVLNVRAEALMPVSSRLVALDRAGILAFADRHRAAARIRLGTLGPRGRAL
jgi:hypothetical protein